MDVRTALKSKTELRCQNSSKGACVYVIQKEIARGASCIVYDAFYRNNSGAKKFVRIKECYPFTLTITRQEDGTLVPIESDKNSFEERKENLRQAFDLGNKLFGTSGLTNFTSNAMDIYELNQTVYIVTAYQEGKILSCSKLSSLKECVAVVKSTAKAVEKIHRSGYLCLDIKPENIFLLTGTTEMIQLFDFDSFVPIDAFEGDCEYKISYTRGFSALELQMGIQKKIGKQTDVYSVGALLFYLIFGTVPTALDSEIDAKYSYEESKYAAKTFQDKMYDELTDFFRRTLANYHLDRYQEMQQVIRKLEMIEKLADTTVPYILNSYISRPKILVGRESELKQLDQWREDAHAFLLFVTGIGGIGKTSLVQEYVASHMFQFDIVLSLNYHHTIKQTIADDRQFMVNALSRSEEEEPDEYFVRKLEVARKLTYGQKVLLMIDNFTGKNLEGVDELIKAGWKLIIITRRQMPEEDYQCIKVEAIQKKTDLHFIFESHLRRAIEPQEYPMLDRIIEMVHGHTLVLELIAKQIANSFLSVSEAEKLIQKYGFSRMASEKVSYTKDFIFHNDTVRSMINVIFDSAKLSEEKRSVLKGIGFFGNSKINIGLFASVYGLKTKDILHELVSEGWLAIEDNMLQMHPVIIEVVRSWKMTDVFEQAAIHMMAELKRWKITNRGLFLSVSEEFLKCCQQEGLMSQQIYKELMFEVLTVMPRYKEDYILTNTLKLVQDPGYLDDNAVIRLYDLISEIYEEQGDLKKAYTVLIQAKERVRRCRDPHIKGQYQYLWVGCYDKKLDGGYDPINIEEAQIYLRLMKSMNQAIKYLKKSCHPEGKQLLAECIRCKANVLIRSRPQKKAKIKRLLSQAEIMVQREGLEETELGNACVLTRAWYYTYVEPDRERAAVCIQQAYKTGIRIYENELDLIDCVFVPAANLFLECGERIKSEKWLILGIRLCEEKEEMIPYSRKKKELERYLEDVRIL